MKDRIAKLICILFGHLRPDADDPAICPRCGYRCTIWPGSKS